MYVTRTAEGDQGESAGASVTAYPPGLVIRSKKVTSPTKSERGYTYSKRHGRLLKPRAAYSASLKGVIESYRQDTIIRRQVRRHHRPNEPNGRQAGGNRRPITRLTRKAANNMKFKARNMEPCKVFLTLTYPGAYPTDGKLVKEHWRKMRAWLVRRGIGGFWCLEFQLRGAPHFHVFLTERVDKEEVSRVWYEIVGSGDEKHLRAGTRIEAIREPQALAVYAAKYACKMEQKDVPEDYQDVGRFWGIFGGCQPKPLLTMEGTLSAMAPIIRAARKIGDWCRQEWGLYPLPRDKGFVGFTLWQVSDRLEIPLLRLLTGVGRAVETATERGFHYWIGPPLQVGASP